MSELRAWLANSKEVAIGTAMPIVDPHHHLWPGSYPDRSTSDNNSLKPFLRRKSMYRVRYLAHDILSEIKESGHNIVATVYLECYSFYNHKAPKHLRSVGETKECQRIADQHHGLCNGIISSVDLTQGPRLVKEALNTHIKAGKNFRGIRHSIAYDKKFQKIVGFGSSDPKLSQNKAFREGLRVLEKMNLVYDIWCVHHQLQQVKELATAFPKLRIVLDHVGSPLGFPPYTSDSEVKRQNMFEKWKNDISEIAKECPNVYVKVGGLTMPWCGFGFEEQENAPSSIQLMKRIGPLYLHVIKEFGSSRCMFESNYPVDKECCDYGVLWNAFKRICHAANFNMFETRDLFFGTAKHVYQLDVSLPNESLYDTSNWNLAKISSFKAVPKF